MNAADFLENTHALLNDRSRVAIMAALASAPDPVEFSALIDALKLSKGNLSTHALRLEEAGLIEIIKEFVGRKPRTSYRCTRKGLTEIQAYLSSLERLLQGAARQR